MGLRPHAIAADNYFVNREDNPKDENGNYDFESLEAMDLETLNRDMTRLLDGEEIELPVFNFKTGVREYHGDLLKIGENDVIIMEGIHSLNPKMTYGLADEDKYKIYVSSLNQLYVEGEDGEPAKVSTIDSRLLRRIVRDSRTRGNDVEKTLSMWSSVRRGEEKYIFPYESEADEMFNSGLLYEYTAIRREARPLLLGVDETSEHYQDAAETSASDRYVPRHRHRIHTSKFHTQRIYRWRMLQDMMKVHTRIKNNQQYKNTAQRQNKCLRAVFFVQNIRKIL